MNSNTSNGAEIAFIDGALSEQAKADIRAALRPGVEYIEISAAADGVSQIQAVLAERTGVSALHIFSEGSAGRFQLGSGVIDQAALSGEAGIAMAGWAGALTADADILIYGCDVGAAGPALTDQIAQLTGADVALSIDKTGAAARGGNWDLELTSGVIDTRMALTAAAAGDVDVLLAAPTVEFAQATENGSVIFIIGTYDKTVVEGLQVEFAGNFFTGVIGSTDPAQQSVLFIDGQWILNYTLDTPLVPGRYDVIVRVTDALGVPLIDGPLTDLTFRDLLVPESELGALSLDLAQVSSDGSTVTLSGIFDVNAAGLQVSLDGVFSHSSLTQPDLFTLNRVSGNWQFAVDQLNLQPGSYQLRVEVIDALGIPVIGAGDLPLAVTDQLLLLPPAVGPSYQVLADPVVVDEGNSVTFTVLTTNVVSGTPLDYTLDGLGIAAEDIVGGQLAGSVVVGADGEASFVVQLVADQLTEGRELLNATVMGRTAGVVINDTSTAILASALELRAVSLQNGVASFEVWLKPGVSVEAGDLVFSSLADQGSFKAGSIQAAAGVSAIENAGEPGSTAISFFTSAPVGGVAGTLLMSLAYDVAQGVQQFDLGLSSALLTFTGTTDGIAVELPPAVSATENAALDLTGIAYHWKSHVLLAAVDVSLRGGEEPVEGNLAPIQLQNLSWDASGLASVEVWATAAADSANLGFSLDLGAGVDALFTPDTALAAWTAQESAVAGGYSFSAATTDPAAALVAGQHRLGVLTFNTGGVDQTQLGLLTGEVGASVSTPYGLHLARTATDAAGSYTLTGLDAGQYALAATRATADTGNAVTSADALAALKIAVGINPNTLVNDVQALVSPYQIMAADVVGTDGRVTSADALAILRMAVRLPSAPISEWLFVEETRDFWDEAANNGQGAFTLTRTATQWDTALSATLQGDQAVNLVGLLKGDVNGSWAAPAGSQDLDLIAPLYFQELSALVGAPLDQWIV